MSAEKLTTEMSGEEKKNIKVIIKIEDHNGSSVSTNMEVPVFGVSIEEAIRKGFDVMDIEILIDDYHKYNVYRHSAHDNDYEDDEDLLALNDSAIYPEHIQKFIEKQRRHRPKMLNVKHLIKKSIFSEIEIFKKIELLKTECAREKEEYSVHPEYETIRNYFFSLIKCEEIFSEKLVVTRPGHMT